MNPIIECVPNFSEGRRPQVIEAIATAIAGRPEDGGPADTAGEGVRILHVDRGEAANRTVITFAGAPEAVCEAAFRGVREAARLIDMRTQHGTHPRLGATDVLPLVPVRGISLEECARLARGLAGRIWRELGIPCYCYGAAASSPERSELSCCRKGEYEALAAKLADPVLRPDFGPVTIGHSPNATGHDPDLVGRSPATLTDGIARTGATNVGARPFLIAVNFNLRPGSGGSSSGEYLRSGTVRKRAARTHFSEPGRLTGETCRVADALTAAKAIAKRMRGPGRKAIGWYIEEYGCAQVSMNLTDTALAPLHEVYEKVCREAEAEGWRISGTEIIGLVPRQVLLDAGNGSLEAAVRRLHLDDLRPFRPEEKVLENLLPI